MSISQFVSFRKIEHTVRLRGNKGRKNNQSINQTSYQAPICVSLSLLVVKAFLRIISA